MIDVENLSKSFTYYQKEAGLKSGIKNLFHREKLTKEVVKSISFHINEGEVVGFIGPNGAGKTTTLKMLSGILHPSGGNISVMGLDPSKHPKELKMNFSIVMGQKTQLWWDLPAVDSFRLNKYIYEINENDFNLAVDELCKLLQLEELKNIQVRKLSLGERMKFELVSALLHKPKVIYLDEPTIGLDIVAQKSIRSFLKEYAKKYKATIILTSHYLKDIEDLCDRVMLINHGQIIFNDSLGKLRSSISNKKMICFDEVTKNEDELSLLFGTEVKIDNSRAKIVVSTDEVDVIMKKLINYIGPEDLSIENLPLEDQIALMYQQ